MAFTILGVDQSLTETGTAAISDDLSLCATSAIKPKSLGVKRLYEIETIIDALITEHNPALVVMEGYAFNPRAGQAFSLGELGGVIKRLCLVRGIRRISVAPGTLKKYITGDGAAKKNTMLLGAYKKFNVSFDNDNICDAYCLARLGKEFLTYEPELDMKKVPASFRDVLKSVLKYNSLVK